MLLVGNNQFQSLSRGAFSSMARLHCSRCRRPSAHCLCALIPQLASRTRVVVLQHPQEAAHALNTARLAVLGLSNSELHCAERFSSLPGLLEDPNYCSCLLFPGADAIPVGEFAGRHADLPLRLLVPDGTWRKARKLLYLNPALAALPRVTLRVSGTSRYRLRKAPAPGALSTLEAIVRALEEVEGGGERFAALLAPFEALIEAQIAAMGSETYRRNHL